MKQTYTPTQLGRIVWLDYAKVIGMFLVIVGHLPFKFNFAISLFHMPLFFMLSGYLYKRRCLKGELIRSGKALILPYIFYNLLIGIVHTLVFRDNPFELLRYIVLFEQEQLPYAFRAMWFLISLFTMRIISSLVGKYSLPISLILFTSCCLYKYICGLEYITSDPFQITSTILCYIFFEIGRYMKVSSTRTVHQPYRKSIMYIMLATYLVICAIILLCVRLNHMREVNLFRSFYGDNIIVFLITSITISFMYMHTMSIFFKKNNKLIEELSNGMIFILCSHQLVIVLCNEFCEFNSVTSILFALLFIFLSIYPIRFLRKYLPIALGR